MKKKKKPLLVVEDDKGLQSQLRWAFEDFEVEVSDERTEAINQLRRIEPGVVILDLGLPPDPGGVTEGLATLTEILALAPETKVIVVTGDSERSNAVKAIALGADGVVIGTAELVALECVRCGNCESGRGCARGIASTDHELGNMVTEEYTEQRIVNLYMAWRKQWCNILRQYGLKSITELVGRSDLLVHLDYLEEKERSKYQPAPYDKVVL